MVIYLEIVLNRYIKTIASALMGRCLDEILSLNSLAN